jgi:hypothetical protein
VTSVVDFRGLVVVRALVTVDSRVEAFDPVGSEDDPQPAAITTTIIPITAHTHGLKRPFARDVTRLAHGAGTSIDVRACILDAGVSALLRADCVPVARQSSER